MVVYFKIFFKSEWHPKYTHTFTGVRCSFEVKGSCRPTLTTRSFPAHLHSSRLEGVAGQAIYKTVKERRCENVCGANTMNCKWLTKALGMKPGCKIINDCCLPSFCHLHLWRRRRQRIKTTIPLILRAHRKFFILPYLPLRSAKVFSMRK